MIGVFDSGVGGLTVLKELFKKLPQYDYFYLGDTARTPYGTRDKKTIIQFSEEAIEYLFQRGCVLVLVACSTVSANALRHLQEKYLRQPKITNRKILGIIKPQAETAVQTTKNGNIGVVGTRATILSESFDIELKHLKSDVKVHKRACPLLVPLVEEHWHKKRETKMILKKYLLYLKHCHIDTLILGCTHYPFLFKEFRQIMGKNVSVLHPGEIVAKSFQDYLGRHTEIEQLLEKKGQRFFATTDDPKKFKTIGSEFLGQNIGEVQKITISR